MISLKLRFVTVCYFSDGNLMKFNECRDQVACKFATKSTARFFKAEVVSRSKYIYDILYETWLVVVDISRTT